jgi:tetratricopeptide (TPR) repeat protein/CBS domain-containing protein
VGAYALVGMGTAFAGIIRVPLTSVIMIFEITRDYSIIVPLMISNLMSYFISSRLQEESVYEALLHQDGIHLPSGAAARRTLLMVGQALRPAIQTLSADLPVSEAAALVNREAGAWPVVDEGGLRGMLTEGQLDRALAMKEDYGDEKLGQIVPAPNPDKLDAEDFPHVHPDHTLDVAMRRLAETGLSVLPVVSRTNIRELKGTISMPDILAAYAMGKVLESPAGSPPQVGKPVVLLAGVLAVLIGLAVLGGFLSYYYRAERAGRAQHFHEQGDKLMAKDLYEEAIGQYREALSMSHSSPDRLALALALVKAGQLNEAAIYLGELLRSDPGSAPANLGMARVYAQEGHIDEALGYYHHAIYGVWPANAVERRFQTRLELIHVLGQAGRRQQAQLELLSALSTLATLPNDVAFRKQVAPLLLAYGLSKEAADLFRVVAQRDSQDQAAFAGLGEAEFDLGHYPAARDALSTALRLSPNDGVVRKRLESCDRIMALDPTARGLGAIERFHRSQEVLTGVLDALDKCSPPSLREAMAAARRSLAEDQRPRSFSDAAVNETAAAERLWVAAAATAKVCGAWPRADSPLSRVMAKLVAR